MTFIKKNDLNHKDNQDLKGLLVDKPLGLWKNIFEKKKVDEEIDDDGDIHRAFLKLAELNPSISGLK